MAWHHNEYDGVLRYTGRWVALGTASAVNRLLLEWPQSDDPHIVDYITIKLRRMEELDGTLEMAYDWRGSRAGDVVWRFVWQFDDAAVPDVLAYLNACSHAVPAMATT